MGTHSQDYQVQQALASLNEAKARIRFAETIAQRDYQQALSDLYKWTRRYELAVQENNHDWVSKAKFQMERHEAIVERLAKLAGEQMPQLASINQKLSFYKGQINKLSSSSVPKIQKNQEQLASHNVTQNNEDIKQLELNEPQQKVEDIDKELEVLKEQIFGLNLPQLQKQEESKPKDLLKISIQETEQAIQEATNRLASMNEDYQKAQEEATKLQQEMVLALQTSTNNHDNALILEKLISKTAKDQYIDLIEAQMKQQTETIKLLNNNLATLESFKVYFDSNITTINNSDVDDELELLRKQLDEM
ncbi:hypothetical protein RIVM261_056230 [Rivularia sp. IAM M-261]|nr:hypothetical protein RIVM261_056230 [Rivularia sp. IAM M-261]